ncbi:MAG: hypothetical protein ACFFD8_07495 [Candidatus Thorarchaeota archaeon]
MSLSRVKKSSIKTDKIGDRLLEIGKDYLAGQTLAALTELSSVGPLNFSDAFYVIDKLGPDLMRREKRVLLDLLTEVVILSQCDVGMDKQVLREYLKKRIRHSGDLGEFIFQLIQQVNGAHNT